MEYSELCEKLLHAETEQDVDAILDIAGYLEDGSAWLPVGFENNFAAIGNQQSDPSGALVEKIINSIDAVLMAECYKENIDPESEQAPRTMVSAVDKYFNVKDGRLDNLTPSEQTKLAENIHLVAVGDKETPNYLIVDKGEGQTPLRFPYTLVSLMLSNKIRIPFVQGKYNSGGTGILQSCGTRNFELIISKRHPGCPVEPEDNTGNFWGFTIVRRLLPSGGRKSSMYVYLAPGGNIPAFEAASIKVLPGRSAPNRPPEPYAIELNYGTCIKLYNYRWRARSTLTTEGRYELEHFLHSPCLPFRVTETRDYRANYYSATIIGGWASATSEDGDGEISKLEEDFPAYAELNIKDIGRFPYQIAVFKQGTNPRHIPYGVFFVVNGQVHGSLPSDFITRRLKFDYLIGSNGPLLVSIDCTNMDERVREDFFMSSRDRIRKNEVYSIIEEKLTVALKEHPGLQEINQRRRKQLLETHLSESAPLDAFQKILDVDPTLSSLFAAGDRLVTSTGPSDKTPFIGRRFPSFFRLTNEPSEGLIKVCPINRTCRIEFETDAVNDYFTRAVDPGRIIINPPDLIEHSHLWNGHFETRFRVPWNAQPGSLFPITVKVLDIERETRGMPFISKFTLKADQEVNDETDSGSPSRPRTASPNGKKSGVVLALPNIIEVHREDWDKYEFDRFSAIQIKHGEQQQGFDCFINIDNTFLLTELSKAREEDKPLVKFWFSYGIVLAALGMIKYELRQKGQAVPQSELPTINMNDDVDLEQICCHCNGLAQVIVPIIRTLYRGPIPQAV